MTINEIAKKYNCSDLIRKKEKYDNVKLGPIYKK